MKYRKWGERFARRSDMTIGLVHLTKSVDIDGKEMNALEVLIKILGEKRLKGSTTDTGFIVGDKRATCFQESTISSIAENLMYEKEKSEKIRYEGYGLVFDQQYIYNKGGRPVIYDKTEEAKNYLNKDKWWRIVNLDLSDDDNIVDWTHEREWRKAGDLLFDLECVSIIVASYADRELLIKGCKEKDIDLEKVASIIVLADIIY